MVRPSKSWKDKKNHYIDAITSEWYRNLVELQNGLCFATYDFYKEKSMKTLFLPVTSNSISSPMGLGSDSLPVEIELFKTKTYLTDSMQFMLEYGCRYFKEGCFYLMPSFRGENADKRHLCQFYHSEAEIVGDLFDVINLVEEYLHYLGKYFLNNYKNIIENVTGTIEHIEKMLDWTRFPQVTYEEAITLLKEKKGCLRTDENNITFITALGEKELIDIYGGIVWLTYMDKRVVPFYQAQTENHIFAKCADLLFGIGEVVGSGERHETANQVRDALKEHMVSEEDYGWYIEMKDRFPLRTAGFGMGIERYLLWLLKNDDIRDCQLLPRFNGEVYIP